MILRVRSLALLIVPAFFVFGAGCTPLPWTRTTAHNSSSGLTALSSADRTTALRNTSGTTMEIHERSIRAGGELFQNDARAKAVRFVRVEEAETGSFMRLSWSMNVPATKDDLREARGTIARLDLAKTHHLFLPILWFEGDGTAPATSGLWLSQEVFEELRRTRTSTIYWGVLDSLAAIDRPSPEFKRADQLLHKKVAEAGTTTDVDLMKVQGDVIDWPLFVNDASTTVQVIKARGWYGDIVVLNNPENPLILKLSLTPSASFTPSEAADFVRIKDYVEFEITRIRVPSTPS
jgi:hypothetical protein